MMRGSFLLLIFLTIHFILPAQVTELPVAGTEQQLENITENNADTETEDDSYLQEMLQYQEDPINLNTADEIFLQELKILSVMQVENLVAYRRVFGKLISIYELQAIPGWDMQTIRKLRPYITVENGINAISSLRTRLKKGEQSILVRGTQVLERSKGFFRDSSSNNSVYSGSPQKLLVRYKYIYKNLLQYGITAEKDPGEQFFKGSQKKGFDFYSAHFFLRNLGIIHSLALGDYTVNMGQGLVQWQSLAFKKGSDMRGIKRQSTVLRPYNSSGEINFHRGVGITIGKRNMELTFFGSYRKIDANFIPADTLANGDFVSSLQTSGYHRTQNELDDKHIQKQISFGGNFAVQFQKLHLGLNAIHYKFNYPLLKDPQPYNLYALSGKSFGNYSLDYSYTFKNMHIFGELAAANKKSLAFINGLLISVSANADLGFLYRNISPAYQSLYTNAFTENSYPNNEKGLFSSTSIRPYQGWQLDAYIDLYKFPWLRYQVNAPGTGSDFSIQVIYKPNRQLEIYSRFKRGSKAADHNPDELALSPVIYQQATGWRTQFSYKIDQQFNFRNRVEIVWFGGKREEASQGFLLDADLLYMPLLKPFSANIRLQYFQTDDYNSRLYAYENDVLYSYSIPVFYGKGYRYYLNINYTMFRKMSFWARIAQTIYPGRATIGSGLDEINGNRKTEVKLQVQYRF